MDVEKTIEFILASQARVQARFEAGETRTEAYVERANAEMSYIRQKLQQTAVIQQGQARILAQIEKNVGISQAHKALAVAQKDKTQRLRHSSNRFAVEAMGAMAQNSKASYFHNSRNCFRSASDMPAFFRMSARALNSRR